MAEYLVARVYHRFEPRIGWLPFALLLVALLLVMAAALEVGWVPEDRAIIPLALSAYGLALWLAGRRLPGWAAWAVLVLSGIGLSVLALARPWPPWDVYLEGRAAMVQHAAEALALFSDRVGGWARAVTGGGRSTETLGFAWLLALAAWLLGAFLGWSAARLARPVLGLTALGVALSLATYFGRAGVYWVVAFVGVATVAVAIAQYGVMEAAWERRGTDYSAEVRPELLVYAGTASLLLMSLAFALPAINVRAIAESFRRQPVVNEAEATLSRVFAGVTQPSLPIEEVVRGGRVGVLPRAFLLGSAPELLEDVVLTAEVMTPPGVANPPPRVHWRATSYDVYTGRGWLRSAEREQLIAADELIPPEPGAVAAAATITQTITVAEPARTTFYTLGRIFTIDRPAVGYWRGVDDLVRVRDAAPTVPAYQALSEITTAGASDLRAARLGDVPPAILARYTALPDDVPPRVAQLAREVVGLASETATDAAPTPYDQARALEAFLRQYPYSLDVGLPPPDGDMVDYFLFDLQTGFCDYYATAMVVMARSLGLPARLAIGFLPQPPNDTGQQVLRQLDSHSWAEVYFAGYGWVEFDPTAPIPGQEFAAALSTPTLPDLSEAVTPAPALPMPERAPERRIPWPLVAAFVVAAVALSGWWLAYARRSRARPPGLDAIQSAYYDLQRESARLGYVAHDSETPNEFVTALSGRLRTIDPENEPSAVGPALQRLGDLYQRRQYSPPSRRPTERQAAEAVALWATVRAYLRRLTSPWHALRRRRGR